jgi:hypothetical protein
VKSQHRQQLKVDRRFSREYYANIASIPNYELDDLLSGERRALSRLRDFDDELDNDLGCG